MFFILKALIPGSLYNPYKELFSSNQLKSQNITPCCPAACCTSGENGLDSQPGNLRSAMERSLRKPRAIFLFTDFLHHLDRESKIVLSISPYGWTRTKTNFPSPSKNIWKRPHPQNKQDPWRHQIFPCSLDFESRWQPMPWRGGGSQFFGSCSRKWTFQFQICGAKLVSALACICCREQTIEACLCNARCFCLLSVLWKFPFDQRI